MSALASDCAKWRKQFCGKEAKKAFNTKCITRISLVATETNKHKFSDENGYSK